MVAVPGLMEQPQGELKVIFESWAEGEDSELIKTAAWWEKLLKNERKGRLQYRNKRS